jgi:hypothetical protein
MLLLARLVVATGKNETIGNLARALKPMFISRMNSHDWEEALTKSFQELVGRGAAEKVQTDATADRTPRYRLATEGRIELQRFLGTEYIPTRIVWPRFRDKYLVAKSLGIHLASQADYKRMTPGTVVALVLKRGLGLPLGPWPTLAQARDAVCWAALGVRSDKRFTGKDAFAYLGAALDQVDDGLRGRLTENMLAAIMVGARNSGRSALANALIERLIFPEEAEPRDVTAPSGHEVGAADPSDHGFAMQVQKVADATASGRVGGDKVFICHVWRQLKERHAGAYLDEDTFKKRLIECHRQGLLTLAQEDLPDRRDPVDIRESAVVYLNTVFHYVRSGRS